MSLRIIKNGLLDTIQDDGRYGHQQLGINPGGAMDKTAMHLANALVGNELAEAVIEMHFPAAEILFKETVLIALAGAEFSATVNEEDIPLLHPVLIKKGSVLRFAKMQKGARVYLSARGGFVADKWLGSCSTHLTVKAGGYKGRALQKNDTISLKQKHSYTFSKENDLCEVFHWQASIRELYSENIFRFIAGAEFYLLNDISKQRLASATFTIKPESDRMGYRLRSETLQMQTKKEMISTAVTCGTIQLLPDGQLIVLMADHQTTGGYPRIGHIISADISSLAQLRPGENFSLQETTISAAEKLLSVRQMNLQQLQNACTFRLQEYLNK